MTITHLFKGDGQKIKSPKILKLIRGKDANKSTIE